MEDELHPRSELYYRQQARPIPPIQTLALPTWRPSSSRRLTTPNSRTDSVALAKGALRLVKQGLSFIGQPEAENKFYRCEVGDQYTKESMKEWVEKCVAREMRQDKAHIQTFETAQQLVLCVMSVSALHALFPHVDRSFFVGWKRFRESERPQFSCTLFPYGRRKKESERLEWVGEGEERKQVRKMVYGVEDVEFWVTSDGMCNVAGVFKQCFMDSDSELFVWGRGQGGELEECVGDYKKEDIILTFSQAQTISRGGGGGFKLHKKVIEVAKKVFAFQQAVEPVKMPQHTLSVQVTIGRRAYYQTPPPNAANTFCLELKEDALFWQEPLPVQQPLQPLEEPQPVEELVEGQRGEEEERGEEPQQQFQGGKEEDLHFSDQQLLLGGADCSSSEEDV
eukprot:g58568.t1